MNRCLDSISLEELNDFNLNGILITPEDIKRTLQMQEGDRAVIRCDGYSNEIVIMVKPSRHRVKVELAKSVIEDLQRSYPNSFRTRTDGNKTITTFWPNGYPVSETTFTAEPPLVDENKETTFTAHGEESYEGIATVHPGDRAAHVIGKAIGYIRAYDQFVKAISGINWFECDLLELIR